MHIGIDVGGTNTDAVLMDGTRTLAGVKHSTTPDVTDGIVQRHRGPAGTASVRGVGDRRRDDRHDPLHQRPRAGQPPRSDRRAAPRAARDPCPAAADRLARGARRGDEGAQLPRARWLRVRRPSDLADRPRRAARRRRRHEGQRHPPGRHLVGVQPGQPRDLETQAAEITVGDVLGPDVAISLSHEIGRIGLLERENATIINAALRELASEIVDGLTAAVRAQGIEAPIFLSQNDGTLMDDEYVRRYLGGHLPRGPTNSMRAVRPRPAA